MTEPVQRPSEPLAEGSQTQSQLSFLKGGEEILKPGDSDESGWGKAALEARKQLSEAMNARNVAFLLGSGCSSFLKGSVQVGIPTMQPLAKEFTGSSEEKEGKLFSTKSERELLKQRLGIEITAGEFAGNLERLMEVLHSLRFALSRSVKAEHKEPFKTVSSIIRRVEKFLLTRCTEGPFASGDSTVLEVYESFYRKLAFRDRSLPRPWVFTTNYDLFNETSMDRLGLPYCNGFSGVVERRFNPTVFRYALAEQLDLTNRKWTAVDGFVYLCKLHGSVNWIEDDHGLFPIREVQSPPKSDFRIMIYPTPAKQGASLGTPYSDLFREFQNRIAREQSVLFTLGYSFEDEHVNNIIYQALSIPTFRLVIFGDPESHPNIKKLCSLRDPRIWTISGNTPIGKAHYFNVFVEKLMPEPPGDKIDSAVKKVVEELIQPTRQRSSEEFAE